MSEKSSQESCLDTRPRTDLAHLVFCTGRCSQYVSTQADGQNLNGQVGPPGERLSPTHFFPQALGLPTSRAVRNKFLVIHRPVSGILSQAKLVHAGSSGSKRVTFVVRSGFLLLDFLDFMCPFLCISRSLRPSWPMLESHVGMEPYYFLNFCLSSRSALSATRVFGGRDIHCIFLVNQVIYSLASLFSSSRSSLSSTDEGLGENWAAITLRFPWWLFPQVSHSWGEWGDRTYGLRYAVSSSALPTLGTGQLFVVGAVPCVAGCPVRGRVFSGVPGLCPLDACNNSLTHHENKNCLQTLSNAVCEVEIALVENHQFGASTF